MAKEPMRRWDKQYFLLTAEADCIHWMLAQMLEKHNKQAPIEQMIAKATGYDKEQLKQVKKLMRRSRFLRKKLEEAN